MISSQARKLGEALVAARLLLPEQLDNAIAIASKENSPSLTIALMELGYLTYKVFEKFVTATFPIKPAIISSKPADPNLVTLVGTPLIHSRMVFPVGLTTIGKHQTLTLGMVDPIDDETIKLVEEKTKCRVVPVLISLPDFRETIRVNQVGPTVDLTSSAGESFSVVPAGKYEDEIVFQADRDKETVTKISPKSIDLKFEDPRKNRDADFLGGNLKKFREEVILKLDMKENDVQYLLQETYTRETLLGDLTQLSMKKLEKINRSLQGDLRLEALANALIAKGVISKRDFLISGAVSLVFGEKKS